MFKILGHLPYTVELPQQDYSKDYLQDIMKTHLFKYIENLPPKTENFQIKNSDIFSYFCLCKVVLTSTHNLFLSRNNKNNVYPCKPQFYYIKWGLRGSKLYRYVFVMIYLVQNNLFSGYSFYLKLCTKILVYYYMI